jgi:hypothetical protein
MMKKPITFALAFVLMLSLAACGGGTGAGSNTNILNHEVTIPAIYGEDWAETVTEENAENGMKSITKNDDGTVTVEFDNYSKFMEYLRAGIKDSLAELPTDEDNCVDATINDSFDEITIIDKGTDYDEADYGFAMLGYSFMLLEYQLYDEVPEDEIGCKFTIKSEATGEILFSNEKN